MNNNCEFAGSKDCLCSACQSMREMIQELEEHRTEEMFSGISEGAMLKYQKEVSEQKE